jgi:hypothetical protein
LAGYQREMPGWSRRQLNSPGKARAYRHAPLAYDLSWWTADGGGGGAGGGYALNGTIGQPDATVLKNGGYTLQAGFWGGVPPEYHILLPMIVR